MSQILHDLCGTFAFNGDVPRDAPRFLEHYGRAHLAHAAAIDMRLPVLPEESIAPATLHQKLSAVIARELLGIADRAVFEAVGCHTTLRPDASLLDKVVFVAEKIRWDQAVRPPYSDALQTALARPLDEGVLVYLCYLWDWRNQLLVVHPWLAEALRELRGVAE